MRVRIEGEGEWDVPDDATPDEIDALARPSAPASSPPSTGEALGRGAIRGLTFGFGDELVGLSEAVVPRKGEEGIPWRERYATARDAARAENAAAKKAHPVAYAGSNVAGGIISTLAAPVFRAAQGASLLARAGAGAASGLPIGAALAAGESEADTLGGVASDAAAGAAGGAVVGGALPAVGAAVSRPAKAFGDWLSRKSTDWGRKVLTGGYTPLSVKKPISAEAVEEAYRQGAIKPLGTTERAAAVLGEARESVGDAYGQILAALEAKGVTGPNAILLARDLAAEAKRSSANSLASARPGLFQGAADELASKVPAAPFTSKRLGLTQAENIKRSLQQAAQNDYVREGGQSISAEARMDLAGRMRQAVEDAVQSQATKAPDEAAAFVPVKQQLSRIIEGSEAANKGAARATRLKHHSLTDEIGKSAMIAGLGPAGIIPGYGLAEAKRQVRVRGPATWGWASKKGADLMSKLAGADVPEGVVAQARTPLTDEALTFLEWLRARAAQSTATDTDPQD